MTVEPPRGVKATLSMCYLNYTDSYLDTKTPKPEAFKKCLFAICFFHALLQVRVTVSSRVTVRVSCLP